jgi:peroxiredoxin
MPVIQSIYEEFFNQAVEVIGVSVEHENALNVPDFVKRKGFTYPIALDGKTISKVYKVTQFPTMYIIDKKGKIIFAGSGEDLDKKKDAIVQLIQKALLTD